MSPSRFRRGPALAVAAALVVAALPGRTSAAGAGTGAATEESAPAAGAILGEMTVSPARPSGRTAFGISGWAVSRCGPPDVAVLVDGEEKSFVKPVYRLPDMAEKYPSMPGSDRSGFWFPFDPEDLPHRPLVIEVRARQAGCGEISLGSVRVTPRDPTSPLLAIPLLLLVLGAVPWLLEKLLPRAPSVSADPRSTALSVGVLFVLLGAVVVLSGNAPGSMVEPGRGFFAPLANWDGENYLSIAHNGYAGTGKETDYAWFPLLPLLARLLGALKLPVPLPLALAVANAAAASLAFGLLARLRPSSRHGLVFLALAPTSFFFAVCYSESLAFVLAVLFLLSVERGRPLAAAAAGFLSGLVRPTGFLVALLALPLLARGDRKGFALAASGPVAGLASFSAFLWVRTGDPLRFFHALRGFSRSTSLHAGRAWDHLAAGALEPLSIDFLGIVLVTLALAGAVRLARSGRTGEALYSAAVALAPLSTMRITGLSRYVLAAFPAMVTVGDSLSARALRIAVWILEVVLLLAFARRFGQFWFVS